MRILIIGCHGFIGSNALRYFKEKKQTVIGCDIQKTEADTFLLHTDLSNISSLFKEHQFDICINASGSATVSFSIQNEQGDYHLNYKNVEKILEAIKIYQPTCKFVNLSSAAVYGNPSALPVKENASTQPISPYGKHKLWSEQLLRSYASQHNLQTLSLRLFSVYGNGLKKQLFWDIFQKSKAASTISLFGNGNETRDFIHINDLMQAFECIISKANFNGASINVASGKEICIKDAADILMQHLNPDHTIKFSGIQNEIDPQFWQADISIIESMGFAPKVNLHEGLKQYASWLKELN
jgi:dTDP-glucose 4,6-dehydratase/UDP-glucose 4-epimerase